MTDTILLGDLTVHRLGFGAMRLPADPDAATAVARRAVELGIDFFDTADSYGLGRNEEAIAAALYPYPEGFVIGTKAGQAHPSAHEWIPLGRPEYLRQQAELSLRRLRVDRLDLLQLHRIDPLVPLADQMGALRQLQHEGKVRHVGLSEVTVDQLVEAREHIDVVSVQNRWNLTDRASADVLAYCEWEGIAFLPWLPIANGRHAEAAGVVAKVAADIGATPAQVALAWLLHRSPVMLPIPGTSSVAHLAENAGARDVRLTPEQFARLDRLTAAAT